MGEAENLGGRKNALDFSGHDIVIVHSCPCISVKNKSCIPPREVQKLWTLSKNDVSIYGHSCNKCSVLLQDVDPGAGDTGGHSPGTYICCTLKSTLRTQYLKKKFIL